MGLMISTKLSKLEDFALARHRDQIKCRVCGRWCLSWLGLRIHIAKKHGVTAAQREPFDPYRSLGGELRAAGPDSAHK